MDFPVVWIYWALSLTIVTYASAYIIRHHREYGYPALVGFYVVYLAASQVLAARFVEFDLGIAVFLAPAGVFIYPFLSQAVDMINEVYGEHKTHIAIGIAFLTQVLLVAFILMTNTLAPAPFFAYESMWQDVFAQSLRIIFASWVTFLVAQNIDAWIFARLKERYPNRVILRSASSDLFSLTVDSVIFVVIAFGGVAPLVPLIIGQIVSKNVVGFLDTPWFWWYKRYLEK